MWQTDKTGANYSELPEEKRQNASTSHSNSPPLEGGEAPCEFNISSVEKFEGIDEFGSFSKRDKFQDVSGSQQATSSAHNVEEDSSKKKLFSLFGHQLLSANSFTQTFLQSILSSVDSKDQVVAEAWTETLLDVIDLLPKDIIKEEIFTLAVNKGQLSQPVSSRLLCCRMLGKLCTKFDSYVIRKEVLPVVLSLCQDVDFEVRGCICRQLDIVARGVGLEATKHAIIPELVELSNDEESSVRLSGIETVVQILPLLDDETCVQAIVPLVQKFCENAICSEDSTLTVVSKQLGQLCVGLEINLSIDQKLWFLKLYRNLAVLGLSHRVNEMGELKFHSPMPDLVPELENKDRFRECRCACAYNFPAMTIFAGQSNFKEELHKTFSELCSDPFLSVRKTIASGFCEVVKFLDLQSSILLPDLVRLLVDDSVEVLKGIIMSLPEILKCICKSQDHVVERKVSTNELVHALITCEESTSVCSNWRLHAEFLTQMSFLPHCLPPDVIYLHFVPLLFLKLHTARPIPCRAAAAYSLLVLLRNTYKLDQRNGIINELIRELCSGRSCHKRMLFIKVCELVMDLFSKAFFKRHFFKPILQLSEDSVPNIRLRLCAVLPKLKSLLQLPKDEALLENLEASVKRLMTEEKDRDVQSAVNRAIQELDKIEMPTEPTSRRTSMDCEAQLADMKKEEHERRLLEMELALDCEDNDHSLSSQSLTRPAKIPVRKSGTLPKSSKTKEFKSNTLTRNMLRSSPRNSPKFQDKCMIQKSLSKPPLSPEKEHPSKYVMSFDSMKTSNWTSPSRLPGRPETPVVRRMLPKTPTSSGSIPKRQNIDRCPSPMPPPRRFSDNALLRARRSPPQEVAQKSVYSSSVLNSAKSVMLHCDETVKLECHVASLDLSNPGSSIPPQKLTSGERSPHRSSRIPTPSPKS